MVYKHSVENCAVGEHYGLSVVRNYEGACHLYGGDGACAILELYIVANPERLEDQYHNASCKILQRAAECHTYCQSRTCQQRHYGVCVYSKRIYGHKDEHKGERYGGEAEGEGGDGGVYVAALHYLADNSLYLLYDPGSYDVDGNGRKHLHPNLYSLFQKQ